MIAGRTPSRGATGNRIDDAIDLLMDARVALEAAGESMAATYVDGAMVSLRFARGQVLRFERTSTPWPIGPSGSERVVFANGLSAPIYSAPIGPDRHVWTRGRLVADAMVAEASADHEIPMGDARDLGRDLQGSAAGRRLAASPVGSAMLVDALSSWSWFHPDADRDWMVCRAGARSVVSMISGGRSPRMLADHLAGRFVDREALEVIESVGWRRCPEERGLFS